MQLIRLIVSPLIFYCYILDSDTKAGIIFERFLALLFDMFSSSLCKRPIWKSLEPLFGPKSSWPLTGKKNVVLKKTSPDHGRGKLRKP